MIHRRAIPPLAAFGAVLALAGCEGGVIGPPRPASGPVGGPRAAPTPARETGGTAGRLGSSGSHVHFDTLAASAETVAAWSLRDPTGEQYRRTRATKGAVGPENPRAVYDPEADALKVTLDPLLNELRGGEMVYLPFSVPEWQPGSTVVVQYECRINRGMAERAWDAGTNGRRTGSFKAMQITTHGQISHEHRIWQPLSAAPLDCPIDWRCYTFKLEGREDRDEYASQAADPTFSGQGSGGRYDSHPGPDSAMVYHKPLPHPQQFKQRADQWLRVTCEFACDAQGRRVRVWVADEESGPALIVASPTDPSRGFLHDFGSPPDAFWVEFDTSQETTYAQPQPERSCWVRNVVVLKGVKGEDVLGGRPSAGGR